MKIDFSIPQKQSKKGILLLFIYSLQRILRASVAIFVVLAINSDKYLDKIIFIAAGVIVLAMIYTFINYYYFTFQIDKNNQQLIISKGFLNKTNISIQLNKIQQTNLNQTLVHKIFNLYEFQVDTAGSSKKEVEIKALTNEVAQQLKAALLELKGTNNEENINNQTESFASENNSEKFIAINFLTLVKTGITSRYVETFAWLIVGLNTLWENQKTFHLEDQVDTSSVQNYINFNSALYLILVGVTSTFLLVILINLVRTVITYFDFTIKKTSNSLVLNYGLLTTRNITINPLKVQLITNTQNYFQKKLDIQTLKIEQASSDVDTKQKKKDKIEVPGCNEVEKNKVFDFIYNQSFGESQIYYPSIRKFIISTFFYIILPLAAIVIFNLSSEMLLWNKIIMPMSMYCIIGIFCSWLAYKNNKIMVYDDYIMVKSGFWDIQTKIIENYKIQGIDVQQYFWQKQTNIASITVYTAGGNLQFSTGFYKELTRLTNYWLYKVEISDKKWM